MRRVLVGLGAVILAGAGGLAFYARSTPEKSPRIEAASPLEKTADRAARPARNYDPDLSTPEKAIRLTLEYAAANDQRYFQIVPQDLTDPEAVAELKKIHQRWDSQHIEVKEIREGHVKARLYDKSGKGFATMRVKYTDDRWQIHN